MEGANSVVDEVSEQLHQSDLLTVQNEWESMDMVRKSALELIYFSNPCSSKESALDINKSFSKFITRATTPRESIEKLNSLSSALLEIGNESSKFANVPTAVLMGKSGSGKTTAFEYLSGQELTVSNISHSLVLESKRGVIGHTVKSMTVVPSWSEMSSDEEKTMVLDTAGFMDTRGETCRGMINYTTKNNITRLNNAVFFLVVKGKFFSGNKFEDSVYSVLASLLCALGDKFQRYLLQPAIPIGLIITALNDNDALGVEGLLDQFKSVIKDYKNGGVNSSDSDLSSLYSAYKFTQKAYANDLVYYMREPKKREIGSRYVNGLVDCRIGTPLERSELVRRVLQISRLSNPTQAIVHADDPVWAVRVARDVMLDLGEGLARQCSQALTDLFNKITDLKERIAVLGENDIVAAKELGKELADIKTKSIQEPNHEDSGVTGRIKYVSLLSALAGLQLSDESNMLIFEVNSFCPGVDRYAELLSCYKSLDVDVERYRGIVSTKESLAVKTNRIANKLTYTEVAAELSAATHILAQERAQFAEKYADVVQGAKCRALSILSPGSIPMYVIRLTSSAGIPVYTTDLSSTSKDLYSLDGGFTQEAIELYDRNLPSREVAKLITEKKSSDVLTIASMLVNPVPIGSVRLERHGLRVYLVTKTLGGTVWTSAHSQHDVVISANSNIPAALISMAASGALFDGSDTTTRNYLERLAMGKLATRSIDLNLSGGVAFHRLEMSQNNKSECFLGIVPVGLKCAASGFGEVAWVAVSNDEVEIVGHNPTRFTINYSPETVMVEGSDEMYRGTMTLSVITSCGVKYLSLMPNKRTHAATVILGSGGTIDVNKFIVRMTGMKARHNAIDGIGAMCEIYGISDTGSGVGYPIRCGGWTMDRKLLLTADGSHHIVLFDVISSRNDGAGNTMLGPASMVNDAIVNLASGTNVYAVSKSSSLYVETCAKGIMTKSESSSMTQKICKQYTESDVVHSVEKSALSSTKPWITVNAAMPTRVDTKAPTRTLWQNFKRTCGLVSKKVH